MAAHLMMKVGDEVREIPLGDEPVVIGRAEDCTVSIADLKSSRKHCTVTPEGGGFVLVDHDSSNGTQLNGQKVKRQALKEGDVFTIGRTNFIFHGPGAGSAAAPAAPGVTERWVLEMETPEGETTTFDLDKKVTIGRNAKNTIAIQDSKASNFHCEVMRDGPGFKVRDLNSTNGTRVDGKIVEDLDLYHGSVISIGKTHFTIRNLALPDTGPGFDSGPVGGPEFATFSRKRRGLPVGLFLFLVLGAAGLYGLNFLLTQQVGRAEFVSPAGNLLEDNYSFEGLTDSRGFPVGYRALQGENDDIRVEPTAARSGRLALHVVKGPSEDPAAEVEVLYGREIPVSMGKAYALSAAVLPGEIQGVCGLKIVWLSRKDPEFRVESYGPVLTAEASGTTDLRAVGTAPLGATIAEAVFYVKGKEGEAWLDDMELREVSSGEERILKGERLEVRVGPRGLFSIRRSGSLKDIARDAQLLVIGEQGKVRQRTCVLDEGYPKEGEGSLEIRGKVLDFASGRWIPFTQTVALTGGEITVGYEVEAQAGVTLAGISFAPDEEEIAGGVGLVSLTSYEVKKGGFEAGGVVRMLWGQNTLPVSFNYQPPVNCIQVRENDEVLFLQLVPRDAEASAFRIAVTIQTNFKAVDAEIREALSAAREAESAGRPGEAIVHLKPVITKYPFMKIPTKSDRPAKGEKTGAEWLERLEKDAFAIADKIRTRFELAEFFRNLREMEAVLGDAGNFLEKYAGSAEEKTVQDLGERTRLAIQDQRLRQGQQDAEGFLLRAREHRDRGEKALARLLFDHVVQTWPGTEWAQAAEKEIRTIDGVAEEGGANGADPPGGGDTKDEAGGGEKEGD